MRPDRIVVGEVRGAEALDLLQAANTGHRGLLTTLHAGGPDEIPARLEAMALAAPGAVLDVVRRLIAGGLGAAVHLERGPAGRRVTAVAELAPDEAGRTRARLVRAAFGRAALAATGHVPAWADRLHASVQHAFDPSAVVPPEPPARDQLLTPAAERPLGISAHHPDAPAGVDRAQVVPVGRS
jgi:Type II/IV secretion system protein